MASLPVKPSMRKRAVEVPEALVKAVKEEQSGVAGATAEEQAWAIMHAAKRALEEEKASAEGSNPSPVVRSLQRFLAQRLAAAAVDVSATGNNPPHPKSY